MTATRIFDRCLGGLELDSVASGLVAADAIAKEASVRILVSRPIEPGRYLVLFEGEVEDVGASLERGRLDAAGAVLDSLFLPNPHASLRPSLNARSEASIEEALGVIETLTVCSSVGAADLAAKAGQVSLVEVRLAMGLSGKSFVTLSGEVGQVAAAVETGAAFAAERGRLVRKVVIPKPDPSLHRWILKPVAPFSEMEWTV
jgi:microcompartment protein CcmL/EutN